MSRRVARPYAAALFSVLQPQGLPALRSAADQLATVAAVLTADRAFLRVFEVPSVAPATKRALIIDIARAMGAAPEVTRVLVLMAGHVRLRFLSEVGELFSRLVDRREGVERGAVTVPAPLTRSQVEALERALQAHLGGRVKLEARVDGTLLAGFVVRIGSRVFDGSLKSQLARFAAQSVE